MRLTVCIPHYRSIDSLKNLLAALNQQRTQFLNLKNDIKTVVVNDDLIIKLNSSEYTYHNLNLNIINKVNEGPAMARNVGIDEAVGKYIFFLDADSIPDNNWLEAMWKSFESDPTIAAIGGQVKPLPKIGIVNEYYNITNRLMTPIFDKLTGEMVAIITANCGFKLNILKSLGGFDGKNFYQSKPGGEDIDLSYRLKQKGFKFKYEPKAIVFHEYSVKFLSIFRTYSNYGRGMRLFCLKHAIDPQSIRQHRLTILSFLYDCLQVFNKTRTAFLKFKKQTTLGKAIIFSSFEVFRHLAYTYGYFIKG